MADEPKRGLEEVMFQETRRGRRPIDPEERRRRQQLLKDFRALLEVATETEFREAIRALGLAEGSAQFDLALQAWREYRGS